MPLPKRYGIKITVAKVAKQPSSKIMDAKESALINRCQNDCCKLTKFQNSRMSKCFEAKTKAPKLRYIYYC